MKKTFYFALTAIAAAAIFAAACDTASQPTPDSPIQGKTIKSGTIGDNLTVTLSSSSGTLKNGKQEIFLAFTDQAGKPVDVGAASLNFYMPAMGSMAAMNDAATLTTTAVPGVYKGSIRLQMAGEWQAQVSIEGAAGTAKASIPMRTQ